eukprot:scaffold662229_cov59-Prasinocladus_malaysianus.AAC.1
MCGFAHRVPLAKDPLPSHNNDACALQEDAERLAELSKALLATHKDVQALRSTTLEARERNSSLEAIRERLQASLRAAQDELAQAEAKQQDLARQLEAEQKGSQEVQTMA